MWTCVYARECSAYRGHTHRITLGYRWLGADRQVLEAKLRSSARALFLTNQLFNLTSSICSTLKDSMIMCDYMFVCDYMHMDVFRHMFLCACKGYKRNAIVDIYPSKGLSLNLGFAFS